MREAESPDAVPALRCLRSPKYRRVRASRPLQRAAGRFYLLDDGSPYNPAALVGEPAQYTLIDTAGTRWAIAVDRGLTSISYASGVKLLVSDSGIVGPGNEAITFVNDLSGRLSQVIAPDGRTF